MCNLQVTMYTLMSTYTITVMSDFQSPLPQPIHSICHAPIMHALGMCLHQRNKKGRINFTKATDTQRYKCGKLNTQNKL